MHCRALFLALTLFSISACTDAEPQSTPVLTRDQLYFDYMVTASENKGDVTLKLEFRQNKRSRGILLTDGARVTLDGEDFKADSSKYSGVYYELSRRLQAFQGHHLISFTGSDSKKLNEEFWFLPFRLKADLPTTIKRQPFSIKIQNPDTSLHVVQLVMVDTSFKSRDVNEDVTVSQGRIDVSQAMLNRLINGPIYLEINSEKSGPLSQKPRKGGRLAIFYSLEREFSLAE